MAAPERAGDTGERGVETTGVRPDESGTRLCTHEREEAAAAIDERSEVIDRHRLSAASDAIDDDEEELELVEVVTAPRRRAAAIPPPPPRRAPPERLDLDELLRGVARTSPLGPPMAPTLGELPPIEATPAIASTVNIEPAPRSRPQWGIAIVVGTTGIVVGAITALALLATAEPEPSASASGDASEASETPEPMPREIVDEVPAPTRPAPARPEPPPPPAIVPPPGPAPVPEPPVLERRVSARRRAAPVAAPVRATATATAEASATEEIAPPTTAEPDADAVPPDGADEATEEASAAAASLPEHPTREDVDAAVERVMPALRACGQGLDLITLELHFVSSGRATTASTDARHLTPQQRSCLARAARGARVPPFSAPHLSVRYPVRL